MKRHGRVSTSAQGDTPQVVCRAFHREGAKKTLSLSIGQVRLMSKLHELLSSCHEIQLFSASYLANLLKWKKQYLT